MRFKNIVDLPARPFSLAPAAGSNRQFRSSTLWRSSNPEVHVNRQRVRMVCTQTDEEVYFDSFNSRHSILTPPLKIH
jgi:hypothetical protein